MIFLPTPFKSAPCQGTDAPEEVHRVGALYRECAAVNMRILSPATADADNAQVLDDGELGGIHLGQGHMGGLRVMRRLGVMMCRRWIPPVVSGE